jgi:hypothetical protein
MQLFKSSVKVVRHRIRLWKLALCLDLAGKSRFLTGLSARFGMTKVLRGFQPGSEMTKILRGLRGPGMTKAWESCFAQAECDC